MRKRYVLFATVFVSFTLLFSTGCFEDPPFTTGVRIKTVEQIGGIGNSQFPVPGVSYSGDISGPVGAGNTGTIPHIDGITGSGGLSDNPKAETDVIWNVITIWNRAIPQCPVGQGSFYVPGGGGIITAICFQF
ncbi:hypothetical protein [Edaphobacter albus]|uniref:hypothetical protein n=1 Tax=Edaphobacter sp. 4G125 TaxID=2763071 RepID=UPI0016473AD8|nr:hypothetical protein [Edaphobacter sp. 4G125]QNI37396.1 hypothetical protein H7846_03525 [Edaphobacter sp. 4G125]